MLKLKHKIQPTDLKLLVAHKQCVQLESTLDDLASLSQESDASYFTVVDNGIPVGLIARVDTQPQATDSHKWLFSKFHTAKTEGPSTNLRDHILPKPLIIEYGSEPDVLFEAVFERSDKHLNEDIILANTDGTYFGNIRACAVMRLLNGFLGKHMRELRQQREALKLKNSQVIKVRRDLELTNEKLEYSRDKALEGVRMKNTFLANMSHEIRTPMNGVFGMIDLLYDTSLDHDQESLLTTARSSAVTLMRIINDILDFSKIEAGKVSIETMPFNIVEVVELSVALYADTATEKEINLSVHFEEVHPWVSGDPHRYQQILNNLISNALKFTDGGSVEVYLTQIQAPTGHGILTEIKDTGIGISQTQILELFKPFTQIDQTHHRKYDGTGLGLSISKNLVELFKGTIDCESVEGEGSVFSVVLPFAPHHESEASTPPKPINQKTFCNSANKGSRMDFNGMPVLLVEDNLVNQEVARRLLLKLNCVVTTAENGKIALEYLQTQEFGCVFMDCQMPVMDGYETTNEIRAGAAGQSSRNVFISAVTAHAMRGEPEKCFESGMDHYFSKPFGLKDFRYALELANQKAETQTTVAD